MVSREAVLGPTAISICEGGPAWTVAYTKEHFRQFVTERNAARLDCDERIYSGDLSWILR
jgi:hypothetical protein